MDCWYHWTARTVAGSGFSRDTRLFPCMECAPLYLYITGDLPSLRDPWCQIVQQRYRFYRGGKNLYFPVCRKLSGRQTFCAKNIDVKANKLLTCINFMHQLRYPVVFWKITRLLIITPNINLKPHSYKGIYKFDFESFPISTQT